jgi:pimeloyl-ACP methyl ester carboxylesterase
VRTPLVALHGFAATPRTWDLVLPHLVRAHEVLAPALAGHAGGPRLDGEVSTAALADHVERAMDDAGVATAHLVGNSLGGHVALQLAARGRARTVVVFAPAGGWAAADGAPRELLRRQRDLLAAARAAAPHAHAIASTPEGRRRATELLVPDGSGLPPELVEELVLGAAGCTGGPALLDHALQADWSLDAERIDCPVRIVWGTEDRLLPWPSAARALRLWLPAADWVELDGAGHCPQLDLPLPTAQLILGVTQG